MQKFIIRILIPLFFIMILPISAEGTSLRNSVVKIFVTANSMDYYKPWQSLGNRQGTGSGCVIEGNKIITNAHVVSDNTFIQVRKESDPQKYTAKLEAIGHDCDLAVLSVEDKTFFDDIIPIEFGELPKLQDTVTVIGFPLGGDKLSITEGVVSRIEVIPYTQSSKKLLGVQIDAAINPGNSGGPIFFNGKLVGIAMQVISSSQNIGFMIPTPIVNHFLDDLKDGNYDGFPTLGIEFYNTENKALREMFQIQNQEGGVFVTHVVPFSSAYGALNPDDIVLEVNGVAIGTDGTYQFRENERLIFSHLINRKQTGEKILIKISRQGKIITKNIRLSHFVSLVPYPNYFDKPPYYIYGGMVLTVLSSDLLRSWGKKWWEKAPINFMNYLVGLGSLNKNLKKEIIVLLNILPDNLNIGYHQYRNEVIEKINGKEFNSFKEFIMLLENNKDDFTIFETDEQFKIIIDNKGIEKITDDIIRRNNIPKKYSEDVAAWLKERESHEPMQN